MTHPLMSLNPKLWLSSELSSDLRPLAEQAWHEFQQAGVPTPKDEAWHYTDLRQFFTPHLSSQYVPAQVHFADAQLVENQWTNTRPEGLEQLPLAEALKKGCGSKTAREIFELFKTAGERVEQDHGSIGACQQAMIKDGHVLRVRKGAKPGCWRWQWKWSSTAPTSLGSLTNLIWLEADAELTLLDEQELSSQADLMNWTHIILEPGARLNYIRLQHNQESSKSLGLLTVRQEENSQTNCVGLFSGGRLCRETWFFQQEGPSAKTEIQALQIGVGRSQQDFHTVVQHQLPLGQSRQSIRALAADQSRLIFNGKIVISKDAQGIDSAQKMQGLLLSERAEIDAQPQLEIYADNVKANHGASVGQLNEEELFYLQSRGLKKSQAMLMLSQGFARDIVSTLKEPKLRGDLESWLTSRLKNVIREEELWASN